MHIRVGFVLVGLLALSGCGPAFEGYVAVTVIDGEVVMIARPCDTTHVESSTSSGLTLVDVLEVGTDVDGGHAVALPSGLRVDDLDPRLTYRVDPETDNISKVMLGVEFRLGDLRNLRPGQVLTDPGLDEEATARAESSTSLTPRVVPAVLDANKFLDIACDQG